MSFLTASVTTPLETMQPMLPGSLIPPHCTDNIQTAIWFVEQEADAAQHPGILLPPNKVMEVSHLRLDQVLHFAKQNMDQFPIYHEHRPRAASQMHLGDTDLWWVRKMEQELGGLAKSQPTLQGQVIQRQILQRGKTTEGHESDGTRSQGGGHGELLQPRAVVQASILGQGPGSCEEVNQKANFPNNRSDEMG